MIPATTRTGRGKLRLWGVAVLFAIFALHSATQTQAADQEKIAVVRSAMPPLPARPERQPEPTYKVQAGLNGEIFPVFANFSSLQPQPSRTWGTFGVTITNSTDGPLRNRVAVQVPGWSDQEIQIAEVAAGDVRTLIFAPTFLPRLYQNHEIVAATAVISATDAGNHEVFRQTVPVRLRAVDDMMWGQNFRYSPFIASWITPHDPRVETVLTQAKEFMPGRRLPGYEDWKNGAEQALATRSQARAIYRALQNQGVSYVKSSLTFGENAEVSQRIRMPGESLRQSAANCIDGAVMYASLFENLGMEPEVLLVPGHAYVGVRLARNSAQFLYIDTALTGRANFDVAVSSAERGLARYAQSDMSHIRVADARAAGIYPMPSPSIVNADMENLFSASASKHTSSPGKRAQAANSSR